MRMTFADFGRKSEMSLEQANEHVSVLEATDIFKLYAYGKKLFIDERGYAHTLHELLDCCNADTLRSIRIRTETDIAELSDKSKKDFPICGVEDPAIIEKKNRLEASLRILDLVWNYRIAKEVIKDEKERIDIEEDLKRQAARMALSEKYKGEYLMDGCDNASKYILKESCPFRNPSGLDVLDNDCCDADDDDYDDDEDNY